ncbi:KinB-signaling pathway activation protein [Neobacillus niacini]|uniref:KinB-signaling pathway activation protein n=1 Tax=Neobacillus niacini TaxID=86668 RepID=UPI00052F4C25|nr:KinB-signaling pathway activation protein [Neobacillus niacini]KGM45224.1 KinB-signaling pathway activation protein [Neobacillus niacini]MEC1524933.1 KinB-signaling pathway activation protein [Neobacillus niacini]
MTSRIWVRLFMTTLLIGGITSAIVGFIINWNEYVHYFIDFRVINILSALFWFILWGILYSVVSQMGFFAYLTVHRFGLGIFKSVSLWNGVQVILILFVLFDVVYLRYETFAKTGESLLSYIVLAALLLIPSLVTAWFKAKQTNREAFIPALFFMIVVTVIEWFPVLRVNEPSWVYLMLFSLLACNAYQLLILHKLNMQSQQHRQSKQSSSSNKKTKSPKKLSKKTVH